tara:strand:+ start:333 stop:506 length:174 start_codon:yes stop_codon:yes gene_type:complete
VDLQTFLDLDPNNEYAYINRSILKETLGDLNGACEDAKKSISLGDDSSVKWFSENCN